MRTSKTANAISISLLLLAAVVTLRNPAAHGAPARATAAELVVSSARDTGPQTLRDAILAADRLSGRAHILVTAKLITLDSPLPALINPRGVDIEAAADSGTLDANHQASGAVLQINSPGSTLKGLHIVHAHGTAILVNAPGVQLESVIIGDSKAGILVNAAARGCAIRASTFERDETGVIAETGVRDLTVLGGMFRDNTRAGVWSVAAPGKGPTAPDSGTEGNRPQEPVQIMDGVFERNGSGVVIANQPVFLRKDRFVGSHDSAVLILGGAARIEDSEIRDSGGTALSVTAGKSVRLTHNTLADNPKVAIMMRDSDVTIENNTLSHNGFGIVSILTQGSLTPQIRGNLITGTTGDGITVIGGAPRLERNQVLDGAGAGLRLLDVVQPNGGLKATPTLEANVFKGNKLDQPVRGTYKMPGAP
jgi:Right handed beta helix region